MDGTHFLYKWRTEWGGCGRDWSVTLERRFRIPGTPLAPADVTRPLALSGICILSGEAQGSLRGGGVVVGVVVGPAEAPEGDFSLSTED